MPYKDPQKQREAKQRYNARNQDRVRSWTKAWSERNKDRRLASAKAWRGRNPGRRFLAKLREYGLTLDDYMRMWEMQRGCCAICFCDLTTLPPKHRHIDHDHKTGLVRGLLCRGCNHGLGGFKDNLASLAEAFQYLLRSRR